MEPSRLATPFVDTERTLGLILGTITAAMSRQPCSPLSTTSPAGVSAADSASVGGGANTTATGIQEAPQPSSLKWSKAAFMRAGCQVILSG